LAQLDVLPSAGTSLLDYKKGVPVGRPRSQEKGDVIDVILKIL
jgi:hypothetical protein